MSNYYVTTHLESRTITDREPLADPFIRHHIRVGWSDIWRALFRGHMHITVSIDADDDTTFRVMNVDRATFPRMRNSSAGEPA